MYSKIIAELASTDSRLEKEAILAKHKSDADFTELLKFSYDPFMMFHVQKVPAQSVVGSETVQSLWDEIRLLLTYLSTRYLSGHAALNSIEQTLNKLTEDEAELLTNVIRKDLRAGISDKTINKVHKGLIPTFELMLTEQEKNAKTTWPTSVEPKLDGLRLAAVYDGVSVQFLSRGGKPFETLDFLTDDVINFLGHQPGMLDGEIMGDDFNETTSGVKRKKANDLTQKVKFIVFDHLTLEEFRTQSCNRKRHERYDRLIQMESESSAERIYVCKAEIVNSAEEAHAKYEEYKRDGYEGAIVKALNGLYEFKRVKYNYKLKPKETADLEITGFEEGEGKYVGMLGAFVVDYKGKSARVGTGFSDEQRQDYWNRRGELVGSLAEVSFMEETKSVKDAGGVMRHPVFIKLRTMKGSKV